MLKIGKKKAKIGSDQLFKDQRPAKHTEIYFFLSVQYS